ncbi:uncharacterized protein LOC103720610 [Phoenix dactylifera]|uniref:Uncharacterized protein LOC103720610 n=1 Tax=Phoenix dactylifera TaxID=42345 RepID=A0A8B7CXD7_PHODC|nr:uncharacterized protein LOC103720610 [Phoenix dactylifera]XP_008808623.1 uncharacterized protein LOC103720610 [Phoenix dactylifera]XP_008808624.1 uncharacterized protein LOC103720610 [Phoenix dactylifera]XP_008808626.1 uncharacterized protein LOC103720610 [Phoenix dactylifera]XP_038971407.1 uncharacterized protein LOC103720610 [Phoenix dactylifera]XP_038971409.1 uncharacterized protein LOC103720610 [Phoenix dactylifera]XP_038971410.1 uncharacterized protein LOC103720610 [Phoenix dactylifer
MGISACHKGCLIESSRSSFVSSTNMTLEDFFTLTEMKDGLSNLARVEELISMLQKLKDHITSNAGDAARQWSTVAGTLVATGNNECLDHFVRLNGLCFLNQWLQETQRCSNDVRDSAVEELIMKLLALLDKLPINSEKSNASGVGITVEQLLGHNNLKIKERAKILYDKWKNAETTEGSCSDHDKGEKCQIEQPKPSDSAQTIEEGISSACPVLDISACKSGADEGNCKVESVGNESHHSNVTRCSDILQKPDSISSEKTCIPDQTPPATSSASADANAALGDVNSSGSSLISNSCQENISATEESSVCPAAGLASSGTCSSQFVKGGDDQPNVSVYKDASASDGVKEMEVNIMESKLTESTQKERTNVLPSSGLTASASQVIAATERTLLCNLDSNKNEARPSEMLEPAPNTLGADCRMPKCLGKPVAHVTKGFQDLSGKSCVIGKLDDPENSRQREEDNESDSGIKDPGSEVDLKATKGMVIPCDSSNVKDTKATRMTNQKSDLGLEYEEIDALEVARQVAIEVEREVADYREPFSSSPEVNSGGTMGAHSPDIEEGKQDESVIGEVNGNKSPAHEKDNSGNASSPKEDGSGITENTSTDPEKPEQDLQSSKLSFSAQEPVGKPVGDRCIFDLNANISAEESDCLTKPIPVVPVNVSTPVAIAPASKGTPGLPVAPLQFGGELGWKGSAATSAFRPASPRRTPDGEKTHSSPKEKPNFLGIDLNVAESEDDVVIGMLSVKKLPASSGLPSGDSSMEVSSRRAERLILDLNRLGDEDASTNLSSSWKIPPLVGDQSLSSASSSSSRQPSMRDFDLNDNPSFLDDGGSPNFYKPSSEAPGTYGGSKLDEHVVTIMGARVAVERKDYANQVQHAFLGVGLNMESGVATRSVLPYGHMPPPAYGYNGLGTGPTMPFPPAYYGPGSFPYMVDSKGVPLAHVMGSAGLNGAPSARQPFLVSVTNAPASSNVYGAFRPGLDLNSGMASIEGGSRDGGSFKQLFWQGENGLMEEQTRTMTQPSSSGTRLKRKEPDSGWEPSHSYG